MTPSLTPSLYLITGEPANKPAKFLKHLETALSAGIQLVQIRARSLTLRDYKILASAAVNLCHQYHAKALLHTHISFLTETQADGVHLPSDALMKLANRPIAPGLIFSTACHNARETTQAKIVGADIITISPVCATTSCPDKPPLGWERFADLTQLTKIPTYALGGMTIEHLPLALSYGASGIAAIQALWSHPADWVKNNPSKVMLYSKEKGEKL